MTKKKRELPDTEEDCVEGRLIAVETRQQWLLSDVAMIKKILWTLLIGAIFSIMIPIFIALYF